MQSLNRHSILLVEDDEEAREILVSVLAVKFPGTTFHSAVNGRTGLECFRKHSPAIVITDVNMPVMDGIRMVREMKTISVGVKLIVLTAYSDKAILENSSAAEINIDHYIPKPADYGRLFAAIEQCRDALEPEHAMTPFQRSEDEKGS